MIDFARRRLWRALGIAVMACSASGQAPSAAGRGDRTAPTSEVATSIYRSGLMAFIVTDKIRVGVDLARGGAISYLSPARSTANLINNHDLGRQVQASFYSGPTPYGAASPSWKGWNWNPIQSGDVYGHAARVTTLRIAGGEVYTRATPYQWALDGVACECMIESWVRASGTAVSVRVRLTNHRRDPIQYPATGQELPAVYTTGSLRHIVSYTGAHPFNGDRTSDLPASFPWTRWAATEGWSALINDQGWGLGVISSITEDFGGGFFGPARDGGPDDPQTGFIRPGLDEILDRNIVYDYSYALTLGSVAQIRALAERVHGSDGRPDVAFVGSRRHWIYRNASDRGWPIGRYLDIDTQSDDPQMIAPPRLFPAASVRSVYVRAAFFGRSGSAQLFWATRGAPMFSQDKSLSFPVVGDGRWRVYRFPVSTNPLWAGDITALRFDPPPGGPGGRAHIASLSWRVPVESGVQMVD